MSFFLRVFVISYIIVQILLQKNIYNILSLNYSLKYFHYFVFFSIKAKKEKESA